MERGVTPPPRDAGILEDWANFFGVFGDQRQEFFDLAALARGELPPDLAGDERLLATLPGVFRVLRGSTPGRDERSEPIEHVRMPEPAEREEVQQRSQGNRLRSQALRRAAPEPGSAARSN